MRFSCFPFVLHMLFLCLPFLFVAGDKKPAYAQQEEQVMPLPVPLHPLRDLELKKEEAELRKKTLERERKDAEKNLAGVREKLVDVAKRVGENETVLQSLEEQIDARKAERDEIESRLKKDRRSLSSLVLALERLERTPPQAVLVRPAAPLETAQSALLLKNILPDIYRRAEDLKLDLARLSEIITEIEEKQKTAQNAALVLEKEQDEMKSLLKERKTLVSQTTANLSQQEKMLANISAQSRDLKDLMSRLEEQQKEMRAEEERKVAAALERKKELRHKNWESSKESQTITNRVRSTPIPKAGAPQLPVSGMIVVGYGQTDEIGAQSQGLRIRSRQGAVVVAPMGGIVRYTGYFKNYGNIIIVEHQKDYHSLIAGLNRIDTVVGQSVAVGEPLGALGGDSPASLYYELRHNGQPVNPSRRFSGL